MSPPTGTRRALTLALPALVGVGALLLAPRASDAYVLTGQELGLAQRDVRVFDNFTDTEANANGNLHAQFPGYNGVELAVWKGIVEWGSAPHGDGSGDPTQTNLGDGGANFDASWQGNASSVGGTNDNIVSELSGGQAGVLAYCELPSNDGWRIRFYQAWTWDDGPGTVPANWMDVQGILTHEYGHALGLDHSSSSSSTMYASVIGNGVANRSISSDDVNGIRAIYGVASASKPVIASMRKCGDTLEITGSGFSTSNNEVWFTKLNAGGSGTPVKVTGVVSSGSGTMISLTVPAAAGSGDVLVKNSGNSNSSLSNAWPFDAANDFGGCGPTAPPVESFCFGDGGVSVGCTPCPCSNDAPSGSVGGCMNTSGIWGILYSTGVASVSVDTLRFDFFGATANTFAVLASADNRLPAVGGACATGSGITAATLDGLRCIGGNLRRHGTRATNSAGASSAPWGPPGGPAGGLIAQGGFSAGQVRQFQVFYRDLATAGCGTGQNTTNACSVTFAP